MFNALIRKARKNQKGFTLVELMVVVVIIGILTAIAVPVYNNVTDKAVRAAIDANVRIIDGAIMMYEASGTGVVPKTGEWTDAETTLAPAFIQEWPTGPEGYTYKVTAGKAVEVAPTPGP